MLAFSKLTLTSQTKQSNITRVILKEMNMFYTSIAFWGDTIYRVSSSKARDGMPSLLPSRKLGFGERFRKGIQFAHKSSFFFFRRVSPRQGKMLWYWTAILKNKQKTTMRNILKFVHRELVPSKNDPDGCFNAASDIANQVAVSAPCSAVRRRSFIFS